MQRDKTATVTAALLILFASPSGAREIVVSPSGGDTATIQAALDQAVAGDIVSVREKATPYFEKVTFRSSGSEAAGPVVLRAAPGERPVIDGTGAPGPHLVLLEDRSRVRIEGLELRNLSDVNDGSAIRVIGSGSHIEIRDNHIHGIRGKNAMAITVYGIRATPLSDLVIDGNLVHDVQAAPSEAITLNGNVTGFAVTNNVVRDVNNIGIDAIGGERDIQSDPALVARSGVIRGNRVERARSRHGGGFAAGIYVDGGRDILVENNTVTGCDVGIEVGAENPGITARGIVVRNNVVFRNEKAGIGFGGYAADRGRVDDSRFEHNTVFENDTLKRGFGELWIQHGTGNRVEHNVFVALAGRTLVNDDVADGGNVIDWNLWWSADPAGAARFVWGGEVFSGYDAWRAASGKGAAGRFADPKLMGPPDDVRLSDASPAVDAGSPAFVADPTERDVDGGVRQSGARTDLGADEHTRCGDAISEAPEACDDGNLVNGDGCDSNCAVTGCGNGIVTAGESCDDGNVAAGDCCSPLCTVESDGSACSDGEPCTRDDACSAGACVGVARPASTCVSLAEGKLVLDPTPGTLRWSATGATTLQIADLGDAVSGQTGWALCVYDQTALGARRVASLWVPAGGFCPRAPCWKTTGGKVLSFSNRSGEKGEVRSVSIRPQASGKTRVLARGSGPSLASAGLLPLSQTPDVVVQLEADHGLCLESRLAAPATRNDAGLFSDRP